MNQCIYCKGVLKPWGKKFCSNKCQSDNAYDKFIAAWKQGADIVSDVMSHHIIRYMFIKYHNQCARCGWSTVHPVTGKIPLEVDHIDGNARNNHEINLILLCPNCHALTSTYKNLNKGKGRLSRKKKYDKILRMPL